MANLTTALLIVLCIDVMLFLGQAAITEANPAGNQFFTCQNDTLGAIADCTNYTLEQNPADLLPGGAVGVNPTTGNVFTDIFSSIFGWISDTFGLSYVLSILGAPANLLQAVGLPQVFSWAVGALWYGINFFVIIAFLWGRQGE